MKKMMSLRVRGSCLAGLAALTVGFVAGAPSAQGVAVHEVVGVESLTPPPQAYTEYEDLMEALKGGRVYLNFRYRYEYVDDDAISREARASTLRTVLGYETGVFQGFRGLIEFEDVSDLQDRYNSTTNGKTQYPVVADPDGTEVNQAYLDYVGIEDTLLRLGRQEVILDNQRFVGPVGWRQNHQSFDAAAAIASGIPNLTAFYAWINQLNRVTGDDNPLGDLDTNTHLVNLGYDIEGFGKATAYMYYLDVDDVDPLSSTTVGARFAGERALGEDFDLVYAGEFANQTDAADNPNDVDQNYYLGELGARFMGVTVKGALEHLGGSGDTGDAFQTPLATLHAFNGWADQFLTTPPDGLDDYYVMASGTFSEIKCTGAYHVFESDEGSTDYGSEFDLGFSYPLTKELVVGATAAWFDGDDGGFDDVTKYWFYLSFAAI
jgi:hypothetical protein